MGLVIALIVLAPFAAAYVGVRYSRSHGPQAVIAAGLGAGLLVFGAWFAGRADEVASEAVVSAVGVVVCLMGLVGLRRRNAS